MASHPHPHHHHHHPHSHPNTAAATTTCCCSFSCCTTPPPPQPPLTDSLLQALTSHLLLQQSPQPHHQHQHQQSNQHHQHHKKQDLHHHHHHHQEQQQDHQTQTILSSLLNRIDALESSLHHLSCSSSSSSSSSLSSRRYRSSSSSLRDVAARTIQTHFRAFLVRRSRTLRNLKDLALIKSAFITLKSSVSDQTHLNPVALSQKAMNLLLDLDSIQGGDPMIRDGKRAISRDLIRFLDFIEGISVKRHELSIKSAKNPRFVQNKNKSRVLGTNSRGLGGRDQREIMEILRNHVQKTSGYARVSGNDDEEVELEVFHPDSDDEQMAGVAISKIGNGILLKRHGVQSRVKKSVSFSENGNATRVFPSRNVNSIVDDDDDDDDQEEREPVESVCREAEEIGSFSKEAEDDEEEEAHTESGGSDQTSDGEENPTRNSRTEGDYVISGHCRGRNGNLAFSAPTPVKMESRADLMKRKMGVKDGHVRDH